MAGVNLTFLSQIASFLTLHILNFCTTLTPATTNARHQRHPLRPVDAVPTPRVDITSPAISQVLSILAATESMPTASDISMPVEVVVKIVEYASARVTEE